MLPSTEGRPPVVVWAKVLLIVTLAWGMPALANCQTYQNEPFEPSTKVFLPSYYGYDPVAFFKSERDEFQKEQQARKKDEFETTAQYQQRLSKMRSGNPFANNMYAFGVQPTKVSYDADKQTFTLAFTPGQAEHNIKYQYVTLQTSVEDAGHHDAENAFGATITVQESSMSVYELWLAKAKGLLGCTTTVTVPLAKARTVSREVRALAVIEPVPPYEALNRDYSKASFSNPTEIRKVTRMIFGRLVEVRFYDLATGRSLGSCP